MPRTLPWKRKENTATTKSRSKTSTKTSAVPAKRKQAETPVLNSDSEDDNPNANKGRKRNSRAPSSSPPPSPPRESFMEEGLENDDRYRLVEDEFLAVAQKFTVHLHAAEYKRQQKMAQSRNVQTINSISRPTVGVLPDHTKRRLDAAERTEAQRKVIGGLVGQNKSIRSDDSDSEHDLPYVGTTLHSLMDSPRRRGISLSKVTSAAATTRASAGFKKPSIHSKDSMYDSPKSKTAVKPSFDRRSIGSSIASTDDDDDLHAPIAAPNFYNRESSPFLPGKPSSGPKHLFPRNELASNPGSSSKTGSSSSLQRQGKARESRKEISLIDSPPPITSTRVSRFELARQVKEKEEKEKKAKIPRDIIPTFL